MPPTPVAAGRLRGLVPPLGRRAWRLLGGVFLFEIGTGMTLPLLIVYLHGPRGLSLSQAGVALSVMGVAGLVGTPIAGVVADRAGAGWTAVGGLLAAAAGTALFLIVDSLWSASVACAFQGAGFAITWVGAFPLLVRAVPADRRGDALGANYAVTNLGLGVGSAAAGVILSVSPGAFGPLFVIDTVTYLIFAGALAALGELGSPTEVRDGPGALRAYSEIVRDTRLVAATAINLLLVAAGYSQMIAAFPAWSTGPVGVNRSVVGFAFAANTWTITAAQLPVLSVVRRHRRTRAVAVCGLLFAACWLITLAAGAAPTRGLATAELVAAAAVFGLGETFLSPSLPAIVNDLAEEHARGRYIAFYSLSWQAGPMIGPLLAGPAIGAGDGAALLAGLAAACALAVPAALWFERHLPRAANASRSVQ